MAPFLIAAAGLAAPKSTYAQGSASQAQTVKLQRPKLNDIHNGMKGVLNDRSSSFVTQNRISELEARIFELEARIFSDVLNSMNDKIPVAMDQINATGTRSLRNARLNIEEKKAVKNALFGNLGPNDDPDNPPSPTLYSIALQDLMQTSCNSDKTRPTLAGLRGNMAVYTEMQRMIDNNHSQIASLSPAQKSTAKTTLTEMIKEVDKQVKNINEAGTVALRRNVYRDGQAAQPNKITASRAKTIKELVFNDLMPKVEAELMNKACGPYRLKITGLSPDTLNASEMDAQFQPRPSRIDITGEKLPDDGDAEVALSDSVGDGKIQLSPDSYYKVSETAARIAVYIDDDIPLTWRTLTVALKDPKNKTAFSFSKIVDIEARVAPRILSIDPDPTQHAGLETAYTISTWGLENARMISLNLGAGNRPIYRIKAPVNKESYIDATPTTPRQTIYNAIINVPREAVESKNENDGGTK